MERIIIGIDAELASERAVDWVIRRACHSALEVKLVTAFDSLTDDPGTVRDRQVALAERIRSAHPDSPVEIVLANASIHRALEERSEDADLLVVGSHRTRPIRSLLSGEVSSLIAEQAHCPTVIVPDDWMPIDGAIVVGVADDDGSDPALLFAIREAEERSAILRLVHAWRGSRGAGTRELHREILDRASRRLRLGYPHSRIVEQLVRDRAADALIAESEAAELIVVGSHHLGLSGGLLLGSIGSSLRRGSRVPLCIVPDTGVRLSEPFVGAGTAGSGS